MRALFNLLVDLFLALGLVLRLPFILLRRRRRPSVVRFRLEGDLPYRSPGRRGFWGRFAGRGQRRPQVASLRELRQAWDRLGTDGRVTTVLLEVESLAMPPAKIAFLRQQIARLKERGKRTVGFSVNPGNAEYVLLCACDEVLLARGGRLDLIGFAAQSLNVRRLLDRLGIQPQFVRRGDYKTAPELFTHEALSDIQRLTLEGLLDERHAELTGAIAQGRRISPEAARKAIDQGPYSAARAQREGLCDGLCNEAELEERLVPGAPKSKSNGRLGSYRDYQSTRAWGSVRWRTRRRQPRVSVVALSGTIVPGKGGRLPLGPQVTSSGQLKDVLRALARDRRTRAVVLYIASPGGSALASELILQEVQRLGTEKPIVAYCDRVAASGGYMAAVGAKEIWCGPGSILGSIGVFAGKFDLSGLFGQVGIARQVITRGANAGLYSSARPFTPAERESLEADVEESYQSFLEHVAQARKQTKEEVHQKAEGRVFSGARAVALGLADRVGGFEEACARALELAGIKAADFELRVIEPGPRRLWLRGLFQLMESTHLYALWWPAWAVDSAAASSWLGLDRPESSA